MRRPIEAIVADMKKPAPERVSDGQRIGIRHQNGSVEWQGRVKDVPLNEFTMDILSGKLQAL